MPTELPKNGWEMINIIDQKPAVAEEKVETSKGKYYVKVIAEAVMVSRNIKFRTIYSEPVYWVSQRLKISWKHIRG